VLIFKGTRRPVPAWSIDPAAHDHSLYKRLHIRLPGTRLRLGWICRLELLTGVVVKRWVFPPDRFVKYGPEDESWARCFSFGHEVAVEQRLDVPRAVVESNDESGCVLVVSGPYALEPS